MTDEPAGIDVAGLIDVVRGVAARGLTFAQDPFDIERYETLVDAAARTYSSLAGLPPDEVRRRFSADTGYPTAKVGADAAVFQADKLLLIQRADSGKWALPGGWVDPGESPECTAVRETQEETGVTVRARSILAVHTQVAEVATGAPHSSVHVLVECVMDGDQVPRSSPEALKAQFVDAESIEAGTWHGDHRTWALAAVARRGFGVAPTG
jgi:ADP-ribose pyrophosphatase YjhB (NUDIX family)